MKRVIPIRHLLDFSYKVCNCCRTLQLFGSTFKQKGRANGWIIKPCFRFRRWGFHFGYPDETLKMNWLQVMAS